MQQLRPFFLLILSVGVALPGAQTFGWYEANSLLAALRQSVPNGNRGGRLLQPGKGYPGGGNASTADKKTAHAYASRVARRSSVLHFASGPGRNLLPAAQDSPQTLRLSDGNRDGTEQVARLLALSKASASRDQARAYLRQAVAPLERVASPLTQAGLWHELGDSYERSAEEMPFKINCYEHSHTLYRQLGNKEREAYMLKELADMHQGQGHFAQALRELFEVLRIQKAIGFRNLHYTYDLLGHVHMAMGNYDQALPCVLAAVASARATADTTSLNSFYYRLAYLYVGLGQRQQALHAYQRLLARYQSQHADLDDIILCAGNITRLLLVLHRPAQAQAFQQQFSQRYPPKQPYDQFQAAIYQGEIYLGLKSYARAEQQFRRALQLGDQSKFWDGTNKNDFIILIYSKLSELYTASGQYAKARFYLQQAFGMARQQPFLIRLANLQLQAFQLDSAQGNLAAAIAHYQHYKTLNDSIFNEKKSNQMLSFQVQYDTQQKEQALVLKEKDISLLTQQSKAQQASIGQRQAERNALLVGTAFLLALLGLGYNRYRLKQRSNQQLEARQQEIDHKNAALQTLVLEKEWLLKEIHHRVKNNLQVVMSLLSSQASHLSNDTALAAIHESQHRVQAMALIHQKLYQSEQVARIAMPDYLNELVVYLRDSYDLPQPLKFELVVEPIALDVTLAVPLGLIINEAITNALKYAFPQGRAGRIRLSLQRQLAATYQLTIEDDGVGLPPNYAPENTRSLGMTLMHGFSRQLGGKLSLNNDCGLKIMLVFSETHLEPVNIRTDYAYQ